MGKPVTVALRLVLVLVLVLVLGLVRGRVVLLEAVAHVFSVEAAVVIRREPLLVNHRARLEGPHNISQNGIIRRLEAARAGSSLVWLPYKHSG
jgi:hypothetical protein